MSELPTPTLPIAAVRLGTGFLRALRLPGFGWSSLGQALRKGWRRRAA